MNIEAQASHLSTREPSPHMREIMETLQNSADPLAELARIERRRSDALIRDAVQSHEKDWHKLVRGLGRNDLPLLLVCVWDRLPLDQKVKGLADTWPSAEFPERQWDRHEWIPMFREVGYIDENQLATPPFEPITLWRGGVKKTRMSWTADREKAEWFAHRFEDRYGAKPGKLWTATVEPSRLLAHFHEKHRSEDEYVIDPDGLRIREIRP